MSDARTRRRKSRSIKAAAVSLGAGAVVAGVVITAQAGVFAPLPASTNAMEKAYQPYFDYDSDSCFPAAAIDAGGKLNGGLQDSGSITGGCRTNHLGKANTYSRAKCNNGWCGIIYTLYFEKDQSAAGNLVANGHRHDWESCVVWVKGGDNRPTYVSASAHGKYSTTTFAGVPREGSRLKCVYHKEGGLTHTMRFAKDGERPEAWGDGGWDEPALVSWDNFPVGNNGVDLRAKLNSATWGNANFPLKDGRFQTELSRAKPAGIPFDPNA